jgi:hypothetical protein
MQIGRCVALVIGSVCAAVSSSLAQVSPVTNQPAPLVACFAEGTDPQYVEQISTLVELQNQFFTNSDYYLGSRWSGAQGTPRTLTWSFVPDGLSISSGIGEGTSPSNLFATMDSGFASQGGRATWVNRFQQIFDRWSQVTGITYVRVTPNGNDWDDGASWGSNASAGLRGDIRISMHFIDGASNVLAYNFFPSSGDMVLDSGDIGNFASVGNQNVFLRNTVAHEHGHGMGLQHVCSSNSSQLMEPFLSTSFDGPRQDDIRGSQRHYGDPKESNESSASGTTLGTLNPSGTLTLGAIPNPLTGSNDPSAALLSIDAAGKTDWYLFTASSGLNATITATPVGSSYDSTAQSGGSCPSGTTTNGLAAANLVVDLFASNGTTLIATSNSASAGSPEVLSNVSLSPGPYFVRVSASGSPTEAQLYRLTVASTCATATFTQQPASQMIEANSTLTLQAAATNATSFRWRRNGFDVVDDGRVTGSSTATLQIQPLMRADSGTYTLTAMNSCGSVSSNPATVEVTCYPNCDGDLSEPIVNVADFGCFLTRFTAHDPWANCDGSTTPPVLNVQDFACFLQRFSAGCP